MKILLMSKLNKELVTHSIECGYADDVKHYDHHGEYSNFNSPCNNKNIQICDNNSIIAISHLDSDTFIGLNRMLGKELPNLDFNLMEKIDNKGSSVASDQELKSDTYYYMIGITSFVRENKFPFCLKDGHIDVTSNILNLITEDSKTFIEFGKKTIEKEIVDYDKCKTNYKENNIALYHVLSDCQFNPSRPYTDGVNVSIVYREIFKSISIYIKPEYDTGLSVNGLFVNGINFAGHKNAGGSPRGVEYLFDDAVEVWKEIIKIKY